MQGGATTTTNSYGIGVDVSGVMDYSQKVTFSDAANTLYVRDLAVQADTANTAYLLSGSDMYKFMSDSLATVVSISVGAGSIAEGSYTISAGTGGGTTLFLMSGSNTVDFGYIGNDSVTFSGSTFKIGNGIVGLGNGATASLGGTTITFTDTGLVGTTWNTDGSVDTADIGALTVTANTATTITLTTAGSTNYLGTVSGNQAVFAGLGLTLDLVAGDYWEADDDLVGLTLTKGVGTDTDTHNLEIAMSNTGLTTGTYTIDKVTANTISIGNGSFTEYATAAGTQTVTFTELGIVLTNSADTANFHAEMFGNDSFVVSNTGITALSVTTSAATGTYTVDDTAGNITVTHSGGSDQTESGSAGNVVNFDQLGIKITLDANYTAGALDDLGISVTSTGASTFQVGSADSANDRISITLDNVTSGSSGLNVDDISLLNAADAQTALTTIDSAIQSLSEARGNIGAYMNRLGYATANLATTIENVQAAESVIRDLDMAEEMTQFTKNQILLQAGTAMLAQANMAPQQVLALFG